MAEINGAQTARRSIVKQQNLQTVLMRLLLANAHTKVQRAVAQHTNILAISGQKNAFSKIPAYGISVKSFKVPSKEELSHDFLWRVHKATPKKGEIKVFNRSHYEDVLVVRSLGFVSDDEAKRRFRLLNNFEEIVAENKTTILKFYLHTSYEEQENRLHERMTNPEKHWKHNDGDWEMRKHWDKFRSYYQDLIDNCSAPFKWNIIPADENRWKEVLVLRKLVETLENLKLKYPKLETKMEE